jgi:hypothetical protein
MQCPFVLLVEVRLREEKVLGSEKEKGLGIGLCYEKMRKNFTMYDRKLF